MGEEAADIGGPSTEFWTMFVEGVAKDYCIGDAGVCLFVKNVPAIQVCV